MDGKAKAPGLTWPRGKPIWRASRAAINAGFAPKWVNLACFANNESALIARCQRLTAEMHAWLSGRRGHELIFDGTVGSLMHFYQVEPNSPYHRLASASRPSYDSYIRKITANVGARRIDRLDGRDLSRWHAEWSGARMTMAVLKAALSFGIACRLDGRRTHRPMIWRNRQGMPASGPPPKSTTGIGSKRNGG